MLLKRLDPKDKQRQGKKLCDTKICLMHEYDVLRLNPTETVNLAEIVKKPPGIPLYKMKFSIRINYSKLSLLDEH